MVNKRSKRSTNHKFRCPYCQQRLWRQGSPKFNLFYQGALEIRQNLHLTPKKAGFLAAQNSTCLDTNRWIEEFFCPEHGIMWLLISRQPDGKFIYNIAEERDWRRTNKTINPNTPNPSVSEFTYKMSRQPRAKMNRYQSIS